MEETILIYVNLWLFCLFIYFTLLSTTRRQPLYPHFALLSRCFGVTNLPWFVLECKG